LKHAHAALQGTKYYHCFALIVVTANHHNGIQQPTERRCAPRWELSSSI